MAFTYRDSFARSGTSNADHIATLQRDGPANGLDGCGGSVSTLLDTLLDELRKASFIEGEDGLGTVFSTDRDLILDVELSNIRL